MGSIKLEIIEANTVTPWSTAQHPPRIQGIAFRPSRPVDEAYLAEVDARSIARTAPERFERDGRPAWTNMYFLDLVSVTAGAFVCDYHLPEPRDLASRRRVLAECGGGRLGVLDAVELVIATRDTRAAWTRWQQLLDPLQPVAPLTWRPPIGPAISVRDGEDDRVEHLVLAVRCVEAADHVWREVTQGKLDQFPLRFVEGSPAQADQRAFHDPG